VAAVAALALPRARVAAVALLALPLRMGNRPLRNALGESVWQPLSCGSRLRENGMGLRIAMG
jgi:hypothetical protein